MSSFNDNLRDSAVFNLASAVTMVVDDSAFGMELTAGALRGFGVQIRYACADAGQAIDIIKDHPIDLLFVDCDMPGLDGHELVRWVRNSGLEPNAFVPIIMTTAHVRKSKVALVRDCGANFLVTKPFSPATLLERVIWVARDSRPYLEAGNYKGPDRRFNATKPRDYDERRSDMVALAAKIASDKAAAAAVETAS